MLEPGESLTLEPFVAHAFWAEGGATLAGEVSLANDDRTRQLLPAAAGRRRRRSMEDAPPRYITVRDHARLAPVASSAAGIAAIVTAEGRMAELAVEMRGVHKWFGAFHVLRNIDLEVARGERIVVCGPSGSGKSTLIRCINRLEEHQRGNHQGRRRRADARRALDPRSPARSRHGVPELQPVSASDDSGELHAGADLGAPDAEARGGGAGDAVPGEGQDPRAGQQISGPACPAASSSAWRSRARCA